jgi:hypothetical protein
LVLKFDGAWRFTPPADGRLRNQVIPNEALVEFFALITKVATQGNRQSILEHFKGHFCAAVGSTHVWSSTESWAETDLQSYMYEAAENAPLFIEAFFDACETLIRINPDYFCPDTAMINAVCARHGIGYEIKPPNLLLRETEALLVAIPERPPTLAEQALEVIHKSLKRSEELLAEGRAREAVQEALWLLETVSTAFRGIDTDIGTLEGKYFNQIVKELKKSHLRKTLGIVLEWITAVHGYLSSPTGGGVRHGIDVKEGLELTINEARLFCNLIRSYLSYLLSEHERLIGKRD